MEIKALNETHLKRAANMVRHNLEDLARKTPGIPQGLAHPGKLLGLLETLHEHSAGLVAVQGDTLLGFLSWWIVDEFRRTPRRAAYVPVWGMAVAGESAHITRALYRAAGAIWSEHDCQVHALTLPANLTPLVQTWFWNGFGLGVVDAARPVEPLGLAPEAAFTLRRATQEDVESVYALDLEHKQHYTRSPVFMAPFPEWTREQIAAFVAAPANSVWMAFEGSKPAGFLVFDAAGGDAHNFFKSDRSVHITGAYLRPEYRGRGLAGRLLDAALGHYAVLGKTSMTVDFESFNPEAANFWMKHFKPTAYSLMRVPEKVSI